MKKPISTRKIILISSAIAAGTLGTSAGIATAIIIGKNNREKLPTYQVVFKNWDDTVLYTQTVKIGGTAVYGGPLPKRPTADWVDYTFTGWDKPLKNILADTEIKAQFKGVKQQYTVNFYKDEAAKEAREVLYTTKCDKGDLNPEYIGDIPTKEPVGDKKYIFGGWYFKQSTWKQGNQDVYAIFNEAPDGMNIKDGVVESFVGTGEITIPEVWGGKEVTTIKANAFSSSTITKVNIPSSIQTIEDKAFQGVKTLTEVKFGQESKLEYLGKDSFSQCSALTYIDLPETLTKLSDRCFKNCSALADVNLGNVVDLATDAFEGCNTLENVQVSDTNPVFITNKNLDGILFKKDETTNDNLILFKCFPGVSDLSKIRQVSNVVTIASEAFADCQKIGVVDLSKTVVANIENRAFADSSITEFISSDYIARYTGATFENCTKLTNVKLGKALVEYGLTAQTFSGCTGLQYIDVDSENDKFESDNGMLYWKDTENKITWLESCPASISAVPDIKDNCVGFDQGAFRSCKALTDFTIPSTVKEIGDYCFKNCPNLINIKFATDGELNPGEQIFLDCDKLENITFAASATVSMSTKAAALSGCPNLQTITVEDGNPVLQSIGGVLFTKPSEKLPQYLMRYPSAKSETSYEIPEGTIGVARQAFDAAKNLVSVKLPSTLKNIFDNAFNNCSELTTIEAAAGYSYTKGTIKSTIFTGCDKLDSVVIHKINDTIDPFLAYIANCLPESGTPLKVKFDLGDTSKQINKNEFSGGWYLKSITLCDGIETIGEVAFKNCINLETVTFPTSLKEISKQSFYLCTGLETITFPEGCNLQQIGQTAFGACTSLVEVDLSECESLTTLGIFSFGSCYSLEKITLPNSITKISADTFNRCTALTDVYFTTGTKEAFTTACGGSLSNVFTEKGTQIITIHCSDGDLTVN